MAVALLRRVADEHQGRRSTWRGRKWYDDKTREQLIAELAALRAELQRQHEELEASRRRLEDLLLDDRRDKRLKALRRRLEEHSG